MSDLNTQSEMLNFSVSEFVSKTASKASTPGGGSVAGVVAALAAGLGEMSLNFSIGKKKFADVKDQHEEIAKNLLQIRTKFLQLIQNDVDAYQGFVETSKLPESPEKSTALYKSLIESIEVPAELARTNLQMLDQLDKLKSICNPWLISDLIAAARLAVAVAALCDFNVRINAKNIEDKTLAQKYKSQSTADRNKTQQLADEIESAVGELLD